MPKPIGNRIPSLHVGNMLKKLLHRKRITHAVLARRMGRNQSTVRNMVQGNTLQTYVLWELSVALNHNFFSDLAAQLNAATEGKLEQEQTELELLKHEYQRLKEERDYMRKALDMLSK
jgi:plasmid maintenance system antidote protein VapI